MAATGPYTAVKRAAVFISIVDTGVHNQRTVWTRRVRHPVLSVYAMHICNNGGFDVSGGVAISQRCQHDGGNSSHVNAIKL